MKTMTKKLGEKTNIISKLTQNKVVIQPRKPILLLFIFRKDKFISLILKKNKK